MRLHLLQSGTMFVSHDKENDNMIKAEYTVAVSEIQGDLRDFRMTCKGILFFDVWNETAGFIEDSKLIFEAKEIADDPDEIKTVSDAIDFFTGNQEMEIVLRGTIAEILNLL